MSSDVRRGSHSQYVPNAFAHSERHEGCEGEGGADWRALAALHARS